MPREHASLVKCDGTGLQKYASVLGAAEINSTFYRRHLPKTFERWRDSVPADFRFAVKLPRAITHEAALVSPRRDLQQFLEDIHGLGDKLGPILVQLPASFEFDRRRVSAFFRCLRARYSGPVACEPRNPGWYDPTVSALFADYGVARVVADPPRPSAAREPSGSASLRYTRWHGSPRVYWSSYEDDALRALAQATRQAPSNCDVWCVFDNTASGAALKDAHRFQQMLAERAKPRRAPRT